MKINWSNLLIVVALVMAGLGIILPQQAAPVASTQSFQCAAGTMCVQNGGKTVEMLSGSSFNIKAGAVFTNGGVTQYPIFAFGTDAINGSMVAHGAGAALTYPSCMVYNAGFLTVSVYISSSNATSVTFGMFDSAGTAYAGAPLAVRCFGFVVP